MAAMLRLNLSWYAYWALSLTDTPISRYYDPLKPWLFDGRREPELPEPEPPEPSFDIDVQQIITRVETDGGEVTDQTFLDALIVDLKTAGVYLLLDALYVPIACKKDVNDRISKLYDLAPAKTGVHYDLSQANAAKQSLFQADQLDRKPWIMFDPIEAGATIARRCFLMWIIRLLVS